MTLWQSMTRAVLGASMSTFGELVTLRPAREYQQDVQGIFRAQHSEISLGDGAISSAMPELDLRAADVVGPPMKQGEEVLVRDVRYRVDDVQPDGEGGVKLKLRRAVVV